MPIRLLAPDVARLIAAGEVVTRPVDVVKELVENAIDATIERRARQPDAEPPFVRIEIRAGGMALIRVVDNGCGIPANELALALQRHATSKVANADDLDEIGTLGFRGEALASIAAVAEVQIVSRTPDAPVGALVNAAAGAIDEPRSHGCAVGTTVSVRNLFANVPARRKFLRTNTGEATAISTLINHYALAYPEIRFSLTNDDRLVMQTSGRGQLQEALIDVLGVKVASQLIPVGDAEADLMVSGFVSTPALNRPTRSGLTLFVNRRWIRSQMLNHAVTDAYPQAMMGGRFPIAVLNVSVPPSLVDVNIHPSKAEVRFANERQVYSLVHRAVHSALSDLAPLPAVSLAPPLEWESTHPRSNPALSANAVALFAPPPVPLPRQPESEVKSTSLAAPESTAPPEPAPAEVAMASLRPVGQVQGTYIIAEDAEGIYFLDQHAAHEAVLYQHFREARHRATIATQELLQPQTVELSFAQEQALASHQADLAALGFIAEPFGDLTGLLRSIPARLHGRNFTRAFLELLDLIVAQSESPDATSDFDPLCARLACHSAVRDGDSLTIEEMRALLEQIERQPELWHYCPHGRPIFLRVSSTQLARDFRRT